MSDEVNDNSLVLQAIAAAGRAYAPYSGYAVGAALLTISGRVYLGVNVENASYGATICAERSAIAQAVSNGEREFVAIAVVSRSAGSPCGICRQVLAEFGPQTRVILANLDGEIRLTVTVDGLLPDAFSAQALTP